MIPGAFSTAIAPLRQNEIQDPIARVAVLLATYNGIKYLADQLDSILNQVYSTVDIWVSDDQSTDGTWEWLCDMSRSDPRISLLPRISRFGNAARNFYRLLSDVDPSGYDFIALSDQDDIWFADKLARSAQLIRAHKVAGLSSNVIAMWPNGRKTLILKSQKQRRLDFLFESAGPGCTYVMTGECVASFQQFLTQHRTEVQKIEFHDWLLYAWARSHGLKWHIDSCPTMYYRQHDKNEYGANRGWRAFRKRIVQVRSGWYREQILRISDLVRSGSSYTAECAATINLVGKGTYIANVILATKVCELRRKMANRAWLFLACLLGEM
jgi:rhamnosyltransferase